MTSRRPSPWNSSGSPRGRSAHGLLDAFDRLPETWNFHRLRVGNIDGSKE